MGDDNHGKELAFVKYVVGHEMGHYVQNNMFGSLSFTYGNNAPTSQPLCRCDHVVTSNQAHCMQSREDIEAAQTEAWGHFFAVDLFNNNSSTDPIMAYYKEFFTGSATLSPPIALHFGNPVLWMESFCPASNRGTEADWTAFLWDINNKGSNKYSFDNLEAVYESACGGTCLSDPVEWPALTGAADSVFGGTSNKALRFRDTGIAHGVDN